MAVVERFRHHTVQAGYDVTGAPDLPAEGVTWSFSPTQVDVTVVHRHPDDPRLSSIRVAGRRRRKDGALDPFETGDHIWRGLAADMPEWVYELAKREIGCSEQLA